VLAALRDAGYTVADLPADGDALIARLTAGVTNEPAVHALRPAFQSFALADYRAQFARLPAAVRDALNARWGEPEADPMLRHGRFMIAGCARATCSSASSRRARATTTTMRATTMRSSCRRMLPGVLLLAARCVPHRRGHPSRQARQPRMAAGQERRAVRRMLARPDARPLPHLYPFIVNDPGEGARPSAARRP
jgi:cobaltochelatase CobN